MSLIQTGFECKFELKLTNMKANMGLVDRVIRIALALLISALYFTNVISGTTAIILLVIAAIFILTTFVAFCPLYSPFKISTRKKTAA